MTIYAFHEMDVVFAELVLESRIHFLDVDAAIGKAWMAGRTRGSRLAAVRRVAGKTAQSFVHSDGSTVVAGVDLARGTRGVALVAQRLTPVRGNLHDAIAVQHFR